MKVVALGIILGILGIIVSIFFLIVRDDIWEKATSIFCILFSIFLILTNIPNGSYTEWKMETESEILPIEDNRYVIDIGNEHVYKISTYSDIGEKVEQYKPIQPVEGESLKNITIDFVEIAKTETAKCIIFTRNPRSILGIPIEDTYTKYTFYIPAA